MPLLGQQMTAAITGPGASPQFYLSITFPTVGVKRWGPSELITPLGSVAGVLTRVGSIKRSVSDREHRMQLNPVTVEIDDSTRTFSNILATYGNRIRGSVVTVTMAHTGVDLANWFTLYTGVLDGWKLCRGAWELTFRNDQSLATRFPKRTLLASDFPFAKQSLYGTFLPLIYGEHDSRGITDRGMVPTLYVDRQGFRYLVALGCVTVNRVYKDGQLLSAAGYTITHPTINGHLYTLIDFTADQGPDAEITCDVTGYEGNGDGTGATIRGTECLAHLLTNFVYGDYSGGMWPLSSHPAIHGSLQPGGRARETLIELGWDKVSRRYGGSSEQSTGLEAISEFCKSLDLVASITNLGKLALGFADHRYDGFTRFYSDGPGESNWVRWQEHEIGESFSLDYDRDSLATRITAQYLYDSVAGRYAQALDVKELSINEDAHVAIEMPWSHASLSV
jgi:hypothetical protein